MSPGERQYSTQRLVRRLAALSPAQRRLFERLQPGRRPVPSAIPPRPPAPAYPLSFAQQRLWLLHQIDPGSPAYNLPFAGTLRGDLDPAALEAALAALARRHEALRTCFQTTPFGTPVQIVEPAAAVPLPRIDLSALPADRRGAELDRLARAEGLLPFDLARCPLLRVRLVHLEEREHTLLVTLPHIVTDAASMAVFVRDLPALYEEVLTGEPAPLPALRVQPADFAVWQRDWLGGETLERLLGYWRERLAGAPTVLDLPADRPRPRCQSDAGGRLELALPPRLTEELRLIGALKGVTPFMLLLAAFGALLGRYAGRDDLLVGSACAGRGPDTEDLIGFFVNTLALRVDLGGDPAFGELLGRVRETCLNAYAHQDLPFEKLVEELGAERDASRPPLVQVSLLAQGAPPPRPEPRGLSLSGFRAVPTGTAKVDLLLALSPSADGREGWIEYRADLFDPATVSRFAGHLLQLLRGVAANPGLRVSELPLLAEPERRRLLVEWNDTARPYPQRLAVHELFEAWAERSPGAVALDRPGEKGGETVTYGELERRAAGLARRLRRLGVGPETVVGLVADRSFGMVTGLLGVLKAGGAYLPLDPTFPEERLLYMMEDSGAAVLLVPGPAEAGLAERLRAGLGVLGRPLCVVRLDGPDPGGPPRRAAADPAPAAGPGHLAYLVYTSGSTGRPKGVAIEHRGLPNLVLEQVQRLEVGPEDRVLQLASPSFDACVWEVWMALATGARLCLVRREDLASSAALAGLLAEREITHLSLPPSVLAALPVADLPAPPLPGLRVLCVAGEPCPPELVRRWGRGRRLLNGYGLTETTVCATLADLEPAPPPAGGNEPRPPIGRPLANFRAYVLDPRLEPAPVGVPGELFLAGPGLARGYVGLPALTAERFLPHPFGAEPGERMLRTGDRARFRAGGDLDLIGRLDDQLKVRGFRIEPAEIEAALLACPGVLEAAVAVPAAGWTRLAAFLSIDPGVDPRPAALRARLAERLPEVMLPSAFVLLPALPRTPTGKVDRAALARLGPPPEAGGDGPAAPVEAALARLWAEVLGVERVSGDDNFFALGGDSLLGLALAERAGERGIRFAPRQLFERPTVAGLAAVATLEPAGGLCSPPDPVPPPAALQT